MQRAELQLSDRQIIDYIEQNWDIEINSISYISTGSNFAFCVILKDQHKVFLKIYQKNDDFSHQLKLQLNSYRKLIAVFAKIKDHNQPKIPQIMVNKKDLYSHEIGNYIFVLYEFIEGAHPNNVNDINSNKLAATFSQLHQLPTEQFLSLPKEDFDIEYALGIKSLLKHYNEIDHENMLIQQRLISHGKLLKQLSNILVTLKENIAIKNLKHVLTHGDGHQYNILQTTSELTLIDWDNVKLAPIERDLWHYIDFTDVITEYLRINIKFVLNQELCFFYKIQRFLEDIRFYLEENNNSEEQKIENTNDFLNHWGWKMRL